MTTVNENTAGKPSTLSSRNTSYTIYKPNGNGDGAAVSFSFNKAKAAVFVEGANQSGERQFDWEKKIIMKWGMSDLGSVLAGLQGKQATIKLFHSTDKANSACKLTRREDVEPDRPPFLFGVSRQDAEDKSVRKVNVTISESEAVILETALRTAIGRILGW